MSLKKFTVSVTRDITEECVVVVEAVSEEVAKDLAYDVANNTDDLPWHTTDWVGDYHFRVLEEKQS